LDLVIDASHLLSLGIHTSSPKYKRPLPPSALLSKKLLLAVQYLLSEHSKTELKGAKRENEFSGKIDGVGDERGGHRREHPRRSGGGRLCHFPLQS
jgi:hypothetical protein